MYLTLEIIALLLVIAAALINVEMLSVFKQTEIQVVAGILLVVVMLYDVVAGFLFGVAIAIVYMKLNKIALAMLNNLPMIGTKYKKDDVLSFETGPYVTAAHLDSAQNNVVDKAASTGFKGMSGGQTYGAQSLDDPLPGLDGMNKYPDNVNLQY